MQLFTHYLNQCMPNGLLPNLRSSYTETVFQEQDDYDEDYDYDKYPIIRIFGHGWDASKDNQDLKNNSWKRVNAIDIDLAWVYGLPERTPYIECEGDFVSENVVGYDYDMVPNMLISISDFKNMPKYTPFKFGIWEVTNTTEIDITNRWTEENTSIFTLREIIRFLNNIYPNGYHLELHMGRNHATEFDEEKMPEYVQYSKEAEQYLMYLDDEEEQLRNLRDVINFTNRTYEEMNKTDSVMDMTELLNELKKIRRPHSSVSSEESSYMEC